MDALPVLLLVLIVALAGYDLRRRRLPNGATLPLLLAGIILGMPGAVETWLGCWLLFAGWRSGALGGGDAKLWMALLWLAPLASSRITGRDALLAMAACLASSGLVQVLFRAVRGGALVGVRGPGAWRAVPFALWLLAAGLELPR
jgi:Flp pilus assembly protein protease CpaA